MFQRSENAEDPNEGGGTQAHGASADSDVTWETVLSNSKIVSAEPSRVEEDAEETQVLTLEEDQSDDAHGPTPVVAAADETQVFSSTDDVEPSSQPEPAMEVQHTEEAQSVVADDAPADADTQRSGGAVDAEEPYFGFEEAVSVSDRSFPSSIPDGLEEPVQLVTHAQRRAQSVVVEEDALVAQEAMQEDAEETQVLRRSLLVSTPSGTEEGTAEGGVRGGTASVTAVGAVAQSHGSDTTPSFEEAMSDKPKVSYFEESLQPELPSRALPRVLSVLLTLIFTPIAWYLVADAAARLAFATDNPMVTGVINPAALGELLAGVIAVVILAILAAQSSLGLIVAGTLVIGVGVPFLVIPGIVRNTGFWGVTRLEEFNAFGSNVSNHFMATGFTGLFVVLGTFLLAFGIALSTVRRTGRSEERQRVLVSEANPPGLKARWARKATAKAQSN